MSGTVIAALVILTYLAHTLAFFLRVRKGEREDRMDNAGRPEQSTRMSPLAPIVRYNSGPKAGQLVGPDIESWFQQDHFQGNPSIVLQWADAHNSLAQAWVGADSTQLQCVNDWAIVHPSVVTQFTKDNPGTPQPQASDLAVVFFETFSKENPGRFQSLITRADSAGKATTTIDRSVEARTFKQQSHPDRCQQARRNAACSCGQPRGPRCNSSQRCCEG